MDLNFYCWKYKPNISHNLSHFFKICLHPAARITLVTLSRCKQSFQVVLHYRWEEKRRIHASHILTPEAYLPIFFCSQLKTDLSGGQFYRTYFHFYSLTIKGGLKLDLKSEINSEILKQETGEDTHSVYQLPNHSSFSDVPMEYQLQTVKYHPFFLSQSQ